MAKKAQIKMFETIAVVIVVFVLAMFALVYYNGVQQREYVKAMEENQRLKAMETMKTANYMPELKCAKDNVDIQNCIDLYKLKAFTGLASSNKLYYSNIFGDSNITLKELYPGSQSYQLYYKRAEKKQSFSKNFVPILIYDSVKGTYSAGIIEIQVFE